MLSIIPSLFRHLERQPDGSRWFVGQPKSTILQVLAEGRKYVAYEDELRASLADRLGGTSRSVSDRILEEMSDHTLVTRPPHEPVLVIDFRCDTSDEESPLSNAANAAAIEQFNFVAVVSWHPGRDGGQDLSVLAYPLFRSPGRDLTFVTPLWLGLNTGGIRILNDKPMPPEFETLLKNLIPLLCFGVALTLHVLSSPACSVMAATGSPIRIGDYSLRPQTIFKVELDDG